MLLIVGHDTPIDILHIARIPALLVVKDGHQGRRATALKRPLYGAIIARQIRVAVQNKKRLPEPRHRLLERPSSPQQAWPIANTLDAQSKAAAVTDTRLDELAQMPDANAHP